MKTYTVRITDEEIRDMEAQINAIDNRLNTATDDLDIGKYSGLIQGIECALSMCGVYLYWTDGRYFLKKERKVTQK